MFNVYIGNNAVSGKVIYDVEKYFIGVSLRDDKFTKDVLSKVEEAKYVDENTFCDRFGRTLYSDCLSTTSKILLLLKYNPGKIFSCDELGWNGYPFLTEVLDGNAYFTEFNYKFPTLNKEQILSINDKLVKTDREVEEVLEQC